jgi:hypothetical protein
MTKFSQNTARVSWRSSERASSGLVENDISGNLLVGRPGGEVHAAYIAATRETQDASLGPPQEAFHG